MCNLLHCGWQRHPCSTGADRWSHAKPRRKGCKGRWGGGAVGLWAFFEYEYEYRFTEYEYEGSVFLGGLVFFSLVLSPPRRTVLVLDLNWNRRGGALPTVGLTRSREGKRRGLLNLCAAAWISRCFLNR
jgi:hypothetical protein